MNFIIVFSVLSVVGDKLIDCYVDNVLSYCSEIKKKSHCPLDRDRGFNFFKGVMGWAV